MIAKIKEFVKAHLDDIILVILVILISLLSFAMGYIMAKQQEKEPIRLENSKHEIRNPKQIINKKSEIRNSKSETMFK